jgi:DNA-binding response OmpR family regulator
VPKRKVLLVDDEVTVLLTMKAVLEISGFDVDTAASAREGKSKIKLREYHMVITDMRMESDAAGREVIQAARRAPYHPAVALLTAFPIEGAEWDELGADKMLIKPMQTSVLLHQIEKLMESHAAKLAKMATETAPVKAAAKKSPATKTVAKKTVSKTSVAKKAVAKKAPATTKIAQKSAAKKR